MNSSTTFSSHKTLPLFQVDSFSASVFRGNPAAVCPLDEWLPDEVMQNIAQENNLSETAFFVRNVDTSLNYDYEIRWFTPTVEVDLCGHATLASAFVIFEHQGFQHNLLRLYSPRSGLLYVEKITFDNSSPQYSMNFPCDTLTHVSPDEAIFKQVSACFPFPPQQVMRGKSDILAVFPSEDEVRTMQPDMHAIATLSCRGVIATAKTHHDTRSPHGESIDFVSRFFAPQVGVNEDPVTGSAHTSLIPFWSDVLGKKDLLAEQCSRRGGLLWCSLRGERVEIRGYCALYMKGEIYV